MRARRSGLALAFALAVGAGACGGGTSGTKGTGGASGQAGGGGGAGAEGGAGGGIDGGVQDAVSVDVEVDGSACTMTVAQHPDEGNQHLTSCLPAPTYGTNPPSSGHHYPTWADYKTYATPVPWGHLVHSLEHGAVIIVYNCPDGCPDEVAAAQAMIDTLPVDPTCAPTTKRRVILAPDPKLDVRWAATAWTWTLRGTCFDAAVFKGFATTHYDHGGEDLCGELGEPFCDVP